MPRTPSKFRDHVSAFAPPSSNRSHPYATHTLQNSTARLVNPSGPSSSRLPVVYLQTFLVSPIVAVSEQQTHVTQIAQTSIIPQRPGQPSQFTIDHILSDVKPKTQSTVMATRIVVPTFTVSEYQAKTENAHKTVVTSATASINPPIDTQATNVCTTLPSARVTRNYPPLEILKSGQELVNQECFETWLRETVKSSFLSFVRSPSWSRAEIAKQLPIFVKEFSTQLESFPVQIGRNYELLKTQFYDWFYIPITSLNIIPSPDLSEHEFIEYKTAIASFKVQIENALYFAELKKFCQQYAPEYVMDWQTSINYLSPSNAPQTLYFTNDSQNNFKKSASAIAKYSVQFLRKMQTDMRQYGRAMEPHIKLTAEEGKAQLMKQVFIDYFNLDLRTKRLRREVCDILQDEKQRIRHRLQTLNRVGSGGDFAADNPELYAEYDRCARSFLMELNDLYNCTKARILAISEKIETVNNTTSL